MSTSKDFIPSGNAQFLVWSNTFNAGIAVQPQLIGLTTAQVDRYGELHGSFEALMALVSSTETRTPSKLIARDESRQQLEAEARLLARIINAFPGTTNEKRSVLGLTVRREPEPIPSPKTSPVFWAESVAGRKVLLRTNGPKGGRVKRPVGVRGVAVYAAVGKNPPAVGSPEWVFQGNTSEHLVEVDFPATVPNGTIVWLCGFYIGSRMESGPISPAISAILPGDLSVTEATLKMAA